MIKTEDSRLVKGTFKKCDMHVHSSSCYSRHYDEDSFFAAVLSSDLDVLAVTDHNSVDADLLPRLQQAMVQKGKTLVGGVEINVRLKKATVETYNLVLGNGSKGDYFHAIVWFPMDQVEEMSDVVRQLFIASILERPHGGGPTEQDLFSLPCKGFSKQTEGVAIFLEEFQEKAAAIPHFFIPHENKGARNLSDYLPNGSRDKPLRSNQEYKDNLFYYSHAMAVEGGEKSRKHISEGLAKELNTTVSSLFFSDAKEVDDIGKKFTWIDFDTDLDSLLLAISDPKSRIKTSDSCPELPQKNTTKFLESVTFDTCIDDAAANGQSVTLRFSPGYNGIVGSRGSGKTLLASLLADKGLDTYSKFVNPDSVKFMAHGGVSTKDHPSCLYLGQGELESIYTNGEYEVIPFLGERVSPLKDKAEKESGKAKDRLNGMLDLEKNLLIAFNKKYQSGPRHIDHFDTDIPSGVTIDSVKQPPRDELQIDEAKISLKDMSGLMDGLKTKSGSIGFKSSYPEDERLFESLETEARAIEKGVSELSARVARLSSCLGDIDPSWFQAREQLISLFTDTLNEYNSSSGSTTLNQYNSKTSAAATFLDDLFELRMSLESLNGEARKEYKRMRKPIEPVKLTNADEPIVISLVYSEETSFDKLFSALLSGHTGDTQALVEAFLYQSDKDKMHKTFDGNKFRGCKGRDLLAHYSKFFELLKKEVNKSDELRTLITIDGKWIGDMSPGMKAQALLKLFLNDEIKAGRWMYIILDQPEDNLDVATIKESLIDRLKELKLNIQFFVVSHSAPIIVNGDARTVIVCENNNDRISYTYGALNDDSIKQSIANVLDGGERYLKMRLNKYNFQIGDAR